MVSIKMCIQLVFAWLFFATLISLFVTIGAFTPAVGLAVLAGISALFFYLASID